MKDDILGLDENYGDHSDTGQEKQTFVYPVMKTYFDEFVKTKHFVF
jgi:hypothetical protein